MATTFATLAPPQSYQLYNVYVGPNRNQFQRATELAIRALVSGLAFGLNKLSFGNGVDGARKYLDQTDKGGLEYARALIYLGYQCEASAKETSQSALLQESKQHFFEATQVLKQVETSDEAQVLTEYCLGKAQDSLQSTHKPKSTYHPKSDPDTTNLSSTSHSDR